MPAFMNSGTSFLGRLPLFADVSSETLSRLEHRMRRRDFAPRAVIVREGTNDDSAFLILSGRVAVRRKDADSGIAFLLAELGEGEMFGEMALLTRKPRAASVVALEATTCGIIEQSDFDQLVAEHPAADVTIRRIEAFAKHRHHRPHGGALDDVRRVIKGVAETYPQLIAEVLIEGLTNVEEVTSVVSVDI
jgi:CRP-like cAMP-binding protein